MKGTFEARLSCGTIGTETLVTHAKIVEAVSRPTRAWVSLRSQGEVDETALPGAVATIELLLDGEVTRAFELVVSSAELVGVHRQGAHLYELELVHELGLLAYRQGLRVFQEKDAQQIVTEVLEAAGIASGGFRFSLVRPPGKRTYCVQYRETDAAFAARLLAHEGIFSYVEGEGADATLVFADDNALLPEIGDGELEVVESSQFGVGVTDFWRELSEASAKASVGDYNSFTPQVNLSSSAAHAAGGPGDWFEFPVGFVTPDEGATLARLRMEALTLRRDVGHARSNASVARAGGVFKLTGAAQDTFQKKYVILSVEHRLTVREESLGPRPQGREGGSEGTAPTYENDFVCVPFVVPVRPDLATPRPIARALESIVVTGPGGEIHTDQEGRTKGKFFWDTVGKDDGTSSCWFRVLQLPIGGSMALARMGWEMGVAFVQGDPDRPIAVTRLYTAEKASPYGYPAAKTRMSFQTPSSPASGKSNELRMEDGGGGMEMFWNASKDFEGQTNNNKTETIGVDEELTVGVDQAVTIGASQTVSIGASRSATLSANHGVNITGDENKSVGGSETVTIGAGLTQNVDGSDSEVTGGSHTTLSGLGVTKTAKGSFSVTVGGSMISAAGMGVTMAVAGAKAETIGGAKISASAKTVTETVVGALARTVGGVMVQAAAANCQGATKGSAAITVGGVGVASSGSKVALRATKISIRVAGVANFLGGGGIVNMTPGSVAFVGLVTLDASGTITLSGNPNLVG